MDNKNNIIDTLIQDICYEEIKIKKYSLYVILLYIICSIFFLSSAYKSGIAFIIFFLIILSIAIRHIWKYKKRRIKELEYSKTVLLKDENKIKEEISKGELNTQKEYLVTESYYIDLSRKNIIRFDDIESPKLKFYFSLFLFVEKVWIEPVYINKY